MRKRTLDMTVGKPASLILSFALSLILGNVFQQLYTVVDTAVVGKALGVKALAALGAADWLNWLMLSMVQGITQEIAEAMNIAYRYLTVMSLCLPVLYVLHVFRSCIQGEGDTVLPMASGVAEFVVRNEAA